MKDVKKNLSDLIGKGYATFFRSKARYLVVKGSRASKKSKTSALKYIINLSRYPLANLLVVRRFERTLPDSCYSDLLWAMDRLGVRSQWKCTKKPLEMTNKVTGQKILFRGLDDAQKITSISVSVGILCWVWIEEAYQVNNEQEFNKLDLSIRGAMPEGYFKQITMTLNPWSERWWGKARFFDAVDKPEICALTTTYHCNEWLDASDLAVFEEMKKNNPRRYLVEGLAQWGRSEGLIYTNVEMRSLDSAELLKDRKNIAFHCIDFGFTDPTVYLGGLINHKEKVIYILKEFYERGLTNQAIAQRLKALGIRGEVVYCDSAEPKSIAELQNEGINAEGSQKGQDSVRFGIQAIQNYKIVVDSTCEEFYNEISNYAWQLDPYGKPTDRPEHDFSHGPDALRYGVVQMITEPDVFSNIFN